jgi:hypothetical protein
MLEALLTGRGKGPISPPTPDDKIFLITADNGFAKELVSNKDNTALAGLVKGSIDGVAIMTNTANGYVTFGYSTAYSPFRRGAKLEAMIYLSDDNVFPGSTYPSLVGWMQAGGTKNYWSFGVMGAKGARKIAFYGWDGSSRLYQGTTVIGQLGWVKLTLELNDDLVLFVDDVEVFRTTISDAALQKFIGAQVGGTIPLTFYRVSNSVSTRTSLAYFSIE